MTPPGDVSMDALPAARPRAQEKRRRVALILTGGTIDAVGTSRLDLAWYNETGQRLADGELRARVPEIDHVASVSEVPFRRLGSHALTSRDWLELGHTIAQIGREGAADGIVVTHGTNTIEETALFLHLTLKTRMPVVLVGSMRPASALSADGDLNLLNSIRVAADPQSAGLGVLVLMNDAVFSARDVTKGSTYRVNAFEGREVGPLGFADADGNIVYYHKPARPHTTRSEFDVDRLTMLPQTDIVISYVGAGGLAVDALVAGGAEGIVSASTGAGFPTPDETEALIRARSRGVVICIASRVGSGRVVQGREMRRRDFVTAGNLPPWKARVLLSLALTGTRDVRRIQRIFDRY